MNFFNIDCHVSVIADIKSIFGRLGHSVESWSLSGHRWVFNLPKAKTNVITPSNWTTIDEKMVDSFYDAHKNYLDQFDGFICTYPPCFLKLFERFNRPIFVVAATRYDHPFTSDPSRLSWLEDSINNNGNLVLVTNNEFDKCYCEKFTKRKWEWIPSLCDYTGCFYSGSKRQSAVFSKFNIPLPDGFVHQSSLGRYSWEDLYSYKSIIHFPYNVSTMSIFEHSRAGVPVSFPTLDHALELIERGFPLFSEIVFSSSNPDRQVERFLNREWLSKSDFYNGTIKANLFRSGFFPIESEVPKTVSEQKILEKWNNLLCSII